MICLSKHKSIPLGLMPQWTPSGSYFKSQLQTWIHQDLVQFREIGKQIQTVLGSVDNPLPHIIFAGNMGMLEIAEGNYTEGKKVLMRSWQMAREY